MHNSCSRVCISTRVCTQTKSFIVTTFLKSTPPTPFPVALPHTRAISVMCTYGRCLINIYCMNKVLSVSEAIWGIMLNNKRAYKEYSGQGWKQGLNGN